jgi:GNAT superfamily N-acetyltransferase
MADEVVIRALGREDLASLLSLYGHLHADDDALPPAERVAEIWDAIMSDPAHVYLGAFAGGELVSACNAAVIPNLTRGARPYAVIENVVTHADHRRRGIGARVMRALLDRCWERRCYKVMLMSGMRRAEIHAFYAALGFDKHGKQAFVITAR